MKINWSDEALEEVEAIIEYIATDNPDAAIALAARIFLLVTDILIANPNFGRPGRTASTRELIVHSSYIVAYSVNESTIEILSVRHTARLWPSSF
jgi:addiction module RelE/StbE family toxin